MEAAKKLAHDLIEKISEKSLLNIIDIMQAINLRDQKLREDIIEKIRNCQDRNEQKKLWLEWEALLPEEEVSDLQYHIYVREKVAKGMAAADAREVVSQEEAKRKVEEWLKSSGQLGIESEVECYVKDGALIVKPVQDLSGGTLAVEVLKDLVRQGNEGEELVAKFQETNVKVRKAVETMIDEADRIANQMTDDGSTKMTEIFDREV
jgi:hypothetical protein